MGRPCLCPGPGAVGLGICCPRPRRLSWELNLATEAPPGPWHREASVSESHLRATFIAGQAWAPVTQDGHHPLSHRLHCPAWELPARVPGLTYEHGAGTKWSLD